LIGCGIDSENIGRFTRYIDRDNALPHVFSKREIAHIHTLENRALGFCASFCCKEAFYKAVRLPFRFSECEFFYRPDDRPELSFSLPRNIIPTLSDVQVKLYHRDRDEILVLLYLFGRPQ
jgi:phosphopantetheinyl transferase (holo-ACP synthase)